MENVKAFTHKIQWKSVTEPLVHKLRTVVLAMRAELRRQWDNLCSQEVIEPIEGSDWLAHVVLACKTNGLLKIWINLRDLNARI